MNLNRNSPAPLWAVLVIGGAVLVTSYVVGVGGVSRPHLPRPLSPRPSTIGLEPALSPQPSSTLVARGGDAVTSVPSMDGRVAVRSDNPCAGSWNSEDGTAQWSWKPSTEPASWPTYSNSEDFFSIQYPPDLGNMYVEYSPRIRGATLKWTAAPCFSVDIHLLDSFGNADGLNIERWLAEHGVTSTTDLSVNINGMRGVVQFWPQCGSVGGDLERDIDGFPYIYDFIFRSFWAPNSYTQCNPADPPPFWRAMLESFRALPAPNPN